MNRTPSVLKCEETKIVLSQIILSLTEFIEKSISVYHTEEVNYEATHNNVFNDTSFGVVNIIVFIYKLVKIMIACLRINFDPLYFGADGIHIYLIINRPTLLNIMVIYTQDTITVAIMIHAKMLHNNIMHVLF